MAKKIMVDVGKVDWKMLRDQKKILVTAFSNAKDQVKMNAYIGIVCLLDSIQDQAAVQIGEKKVFGFK
jgi:glutaredoxin-related protein